MQRTSSKINILHLSDSPWVDGPGRTIIETAAMIDASRFNYIIGGFTNDGHAGSPLVETACRLHLQAVSIRERSAFDIHTFGQILDIIKKNNIHIVDTHEVRSDLIGLICSKIANVKVIATLHGWIPNGLKGKMRVAFDKSLLHLFDHIIVVSNKMGSSVNVHSPRS